MEKEKLNHKLNLILKTIKYNGYAYLFIISNDVNIRNYFFKNISTLESIVIIDDSKIVDDNIIIDNIIKKKNILLTNININNIDSLYYRLVFKRELLWDNNKTIIIISDEKTILPLLQTNQSLASVSSFQFIDDYINEKETQKKLIKDKDSYSH